MKTIEIQYGDDGEHGGVVLHIPDGWDVFLYRGIWFVQNESGIFEKRDDHLERSNGTSAPLKQKG